MKVRPDRWNKTQFFQAVVMSILLYGCTTWTLTKRMEKKLDGNYTRMLRAILNMFCRQHPTKQQLYCYLPLITKTIQIRRTRHAGHCWRRRDELISSILLWTPSHGQVKVGRPAVPIQDVALKTYRERWTIERGGRRGSGRSVLAVRHDDDESYSFVLSWTLEKSNSFIQTFLGVEKYGFNSKNPMENIEKIYYSLLLWW